VSKERRHKRSSAWKVISIILFLTLFPVVFSYSSEIDEIRQAIKAKNAEWTAEQNPISILPPEERRKRLGALEEFETDVGVSTSFYAYAPLALPATFDWRNYNGGNYITPVRDQGSCGSCWAFAPTAALESKALLTFDWPGIDLNLSEQIVLSCSGGGNCATGGYASTASNFLRDTGTNLETCYPYTATDGNCSDACFNWQSSVYRFDSWSYVVNGTTASVDVVKNAIYTNGPVAAWFRVYEDFYSYSSGVYTYTSGTYQGNHFVLVVGWGDSDNAFIVKNSWGTDWGESGYFKINYSELSGETQFGRTTIAYGNAVSIGLGDNISGNTLSAPALAWNPAVNKLFLVVRATNDSIWVSTFNSSGVFNNDWTPIPGETASAPALAWNPYVNKLFLVVRAFDDSIWVSTFDSIGNFNNDWALISGKTASTPALAWNPVANELQMVIRRDDHSLWAGTFNSTGLFNNDWTWISGMTPSAPALAWNSGADKLQMVVRGVDDSIYVSSFNSAGSFNNDWTWIPGRTVETPALAWDGLESNLSMVVRAVDDSIWFSTLPSRGPFNNDWVNIPGRTASAPGTAYLPSIQYLAIVVRASDGSLWKMLY